MEKWVVYLLSETENKFHPIYAGIFFLQAIGWIMTNHLYVRGKSTIHLPAGIHLHGSLDMKSDIDDIYMALQPWMPLSDTPFMSPPHWERIVVLMTWGQKKSKQNLNKAELLARNSWGEIFFDVLPLEKVDNLEHKCYLTAKKIVDYLELNSKYTVFQLSEQPIPGLIRKIKTMIENNRQTSGPDFDLSLITRRPYLDTI